MRLILQSQLFKDVVIVRCTGRIVAGPEVDGLEAEVEKQTRFPGTKVFKFKRVVLQLAEVDFLDSSGLGALVRLQGVMRAAGGDLKLCDLSTQVQRVLEVTKLHKVLAAYPTEDKAIESFAPGAIAHHGATIPSIDNIVCIDTSKDLLIYLKAVLKRSGHDVSTARNVAEAMTLITANKPRIVICGPGMLALPWGSDAVEKFRRMKPAMHVISLPSDFSTAEAGQAGIDLVNSVDSVLGAEA